MKKNSANARPNYVLPKLCGADIELGNFIAGVERPGGTGHEASRALLAQIHGYPKSNRGYFGNLWSNSYGAQRTGAEPYVVDYAVSGAAEANPQDTGRKFLAGNGACVYIDLDHLELCIPEVLSAFDHAAAWHAMLRIARTALALANQHRPESRPIQVLVNNTDGLGLSAYGSHLNFLISRRTFNNIFWRKTHYLPYLASFQVSGIILTGQGKAGAENGRPFTPYQISQRADYLEVLRGLQTTYCRPVVNERDEPLSGRKKDFHLDDPARLHVIHSDSTLAHGSSVLRVGPMQLILACIENDVVDARLILDDPVAAVRAYSRDPSLRSRALLIGGKKLTAVELQSAYLEEVKRHQARGLLEGIVPRAAEIIALWEDTLVKMEKGDLMSLAPRLDWVLKLATIERAMEQNPSLCWESPEVKILDHIYSSLGSDGLYWSYEAGGMTEQLVSDEQIENFTTCPPADTRAWTRGMLLERAARENIEVDSVNWDKITFRIRSSHGWPVLRTIDLDNPLGFTQERTQALFDSSASFNELLDELKAMSTADAQPEPLTAVN
jgi:proteasome accessory factor A